MAFIGYAWLKENLKIESEPLLNVCLQGRENKTLVNADGIEEQYFNTRYIPADDPMAHLEFALKYEVLNLSLIHQIFLKTNPSELIKFIKNKPTGANTRRMGFLYEFLLQKTLNLDFAVSGNYALMLDECKYLTGKTVNIEKWRIKK